MKSYWICWVLIQRLVSLYREGHLDTRRKDGHMKIETEIGAIWPLTKEILMPPEAARDQEDLPIEPLEALWPCPP